MTNRANMPIPAWHNWLSITPIGTVVYWLSGLILVTIMNAHALWELIVGSTAGSVSASDIMPLSDKLLNFQSKFNLPLLMLFWGAFGLVVYGFVWFIVTVMNIGRDQSAEASYLKSGVAPQTSYWQGRLQANLIFLVIFVASLFYFYCLVRLMLPWGATLFHHGLNHGQVWRRVGDIVSSSLVVALGLFGLVVARRILIQAWRSIKSR